MLILFILVVTSILEKSLQKCSDFLDNKLTELEERTSSLTHLFLKFYSNEEIESFRSSGQKNENTELIDSETVESGKYIKSYIICMQQFKQYSKLVWLFEHYTVMQIRIYIL